MDVPVPEAHGTSLCHLCKVAQAPHISSDHFLLSLQQVHKLSAFVHYSTVPESALAPLRNSGCDGMGLTFSFICLFFKL